jgi:hypothetical protein
MFVRLKTVQSGPKTYQYLHVVENRWDNGKVRQHVIASLGRLDDLLRSGDLEQIVRQLAEHCPTVRLVRAQAAGTLEALSDRVWGSTLVFERLWEELGLNDLLRKLSQKASFEFDFERLVFALALQRLLAPGSDLAGSKWVRTVQADGFERLRLAHFYRGVGFLWKNKERIEEALFERERDLFNGELDLVFFDTTSTYFEGKSLEGFARLGKSKDHRPDHLQLVVGIMLRNDGFPVGVDIWPGNTADVKTVLPAIQALRKRFRLHRVVFVCDRGMVSEANLEAIEKAGYPYIVGARMRSNREVRDEVLSRAGRYAEVSENLEVKEVFVDERRYVVCFNPLEAHKDREDREAILAKIRAKLGSGGIKGLLTNRGYKRFLKASAGAVEIDPERVLEDARYDGKYVLRTTTQLPTAEVALAYKQLTWIERLWRDLKTTMEVRPIYHHLKKENVQGHIFTCFLSLHLAALLKRKLAEAHVTAQWDEVIRDLSSLRAVEVELDHQRFLLRTPLTGCAGKVLAATGIKPPPLAQPL